MWPGNQFQEAQRLLENDILKQADYIGYVIAKLLKCVKISMQTDSQITFYRGFKNFFVTFFGKNFYFTLLHKLAQCHYQTVSTSLVIQ